MMYVAIESLCMLNLWVPLATAEDFKYSVSALADNVMMYVNIHCIFNVWLASTIVQLIINTSIISNFLYISVTLKFKKPIN